VAVFGVQWHYEITSKKEQKGSKDKADSHRTTQPKAYGIMAGQIWWLRRVVVFAQPPFGTYSVSFWFFPCPPCLNGFLFFLFFCFEKYFLRESNAPPTTYSYQNNGLCLSL
jgi:hypothetical protein